MTKRFLLGLFIVAAVAGCARPAKAPVWFKPEATQEATDQAVAQCDYETSAATQSTDYSYRSSLGQELDRAIRKRNLMEKCMLARGYYLTSMAH